MVPARTGRGVLPFPVPLALFLRDLGIGFSPFACIEIYKCTIKTPLHGFLSTYLCKISFPETVGKSDLLLLLLLRQGLAL